MEDQIDYVRAGQVARDVFRRANQMTDRATEQGSGVEGSKPIRRVGLTSTQLRVLSAVVSLTSAQGRLSARVRLADIAEIAFGVTESVAWQKDKTAKALKALAERGLIERRPPVGRPRVPSYYVALRAEGNGA